jgi:hypothetical protein
VSGLPEKKVRPLVTYRGPAFRLREELGELLDAMSLLPTLRIGFPVPPLPGPDDLFLDEIVEVRAMVQIDARVRAYPAIK